MNTIGKWSGGGLGPRERFAILKQFRMSITCVFFGCHILVLEWPFCCGRNLYKRV